MLLGARGLQARSWRVQRASTGMSGQRESDLLGRELLVQRHRGQKVQAILGPSGAEAFSAAQDAGACQHGMAAFLCSRWSLEPGSECGPLGIPLRTQQ